MVLSRAKQTLQKYYPSLGIEVQDFILHYIDLCKNPSPNKNPRFYYMLLDHKDVQHFLLRENKTLDFVHKKLKEAWWIEEEDLIQEILLLITKWKVRNPAHHKNRLLIERSLRDYLLHEEKIFHPNRDRLDIENETQSFEMNVDKKIQVPVYDRYLLYLTGALELSHTKTSKIANIDRHQIKTWRILLEKKIQKE